MFRDRTATNFHKHQESLSTLHNERDRDSNAIKAMINSSSGYLLNRYDQVI